MFKWTMDSRMDDSVMDSTMDDGTMDTNGGDGSMNDGSNEDGDYTIIYESDGEEAEVDYYDTDSWAEDLFAVQLYKAMKDIDRKEAQLIEAGWAPTEEKVDKVRRLRAAQSRGQPMYASGGGFGGNNQKEEAPNR